jgi:chromosome segregation ATPase
LFVLPAWEHHPGVEYTREVELQPTVVACVQPRFPAPVSELEKRFMTRINAAQRTEMENIRMRGEVDEVRGENGVLKRQNEMLAKTRDALMYEVGEDGVTWAEKVQAQRERAGKAEREVREAKRQRDEAVEKEERLREEVAELRRELAKLRAGKRRK